MCRVPFFLKRHRRIYGEVGANELQALFWSSFLINLDDAVILGDLVIQKTIDSLQTCVCVCVYEALIHRQKVEGSVCTCFVVRHRDKSHTCTL